MVFSLLVGMHSYAEHVIPKPMGKLIKTDVVKYTNILIFIDYVLVSEIDIVFTVVAKVLS